LPKSRVLFNDLTGCIVRSVLKNYCFLLKYI
jgi:hypothetical protein